MTFITNYFTPKAPITDPYVDPNYPNLIRCPVPAGIRVDKSDQIARMVNKIAVDQGIKYDFSRKVFVLDSTRLSKEELNGRVQIVIKKQGKRPLFADYKLGGIKFPSSSAVHSIEKIQRMHASFKDGSEHSTLMQIKTFLQSEFGFHVRFYTDIYEELISVVKVTEIPPSKKKVTDFSKMYALEGSSISPRNYRFSVLTSEDEIEGLDVNEGTSFFVHGCVLEVNGGTLKAAFQSGLREELEKEIKIPVSSPDTLEKLIQYLYGVSITIESKEEALELYHIADQWQLECLKEMCFPMAMSQHLIMAHPDKLPAWESFQSGDSLDEIVQASEKAHKAIDRIYEVNVAPMIDYLGKRQQLVENS